TQIVDPAPRVINSLPPRELRGTAKAGPDEIGFNAARRLAEALRPLYSDHLKGVYLYGARATGSPPPDADVELVVVLDAVDRYGDELERTSTLCAAASLELGLVVSRVFVSEFD